MVDAAHTDFIEIFTLRHIAGPFNNKSQCELQFEIVDNGGKSVGEFRRRVSPETAEKFREYVGRTYGSHWRLL